MAEALVGTTQFRRNIGARRALLSGEVNASADGLIDFLIMVERLLLPGQAFEIGPLELLARHIAAKRPLGSKELTDLVLNLAVVHAVGIVAAMVSGTTGSGKHLSNGSILTRSKGLGVLLDGAQNLPAFGVIGLTTSLTVGNVTAVAAERIQHLGELARCQQLIKALLAQL